jgi:para-nitrobenzyl esterase
MTIHTKANLTLTGFILFFLIGVGFIRHAAITAPFDTIKVEGGTISGVMNVTGDVHEFKGIPFAAPPVGKLRWKAPRPVIPWKGVKVCDRFGPSPMQKEPVPFSMWSAEWLIPKEPISEDCLYLNVWTGATDLREKRPVLVWIYGGGFTSGGSAVPIYDGEAMAKKGVVVVSCNYRVGIFGFFAHPNLTAESPHNASGNYGLLDQIAALQWVKKNIAAFGGDPDNVTIAGQSAGSMSVNCLVASPLARNLFQKAIGESGAIFTSKSPSLQRAEENGEKLMQLLQVDGISDLRAMPADELLRRASGSREPIVDGYVLPEAVADIFKEGKENNVGLLTGWNQDEGFLAGPAKTAADFQQEAKERYGAAAASFLTFYPANNDSEAAVSQLYLSRDMVFGVQNYTWANVESGRGRKVYVYRFARKPPATGEYKKYGAFHSAEVPYVFDNLRLVDRPWEPIDHQLATLISAYWANFVKTGDPNGDQLPVWGLYSGTDKKIMMIGSDRQETEPMTDKGGLNFLYTQLSGME